MAELCKLLKKIHQIKSGHVFRLKFPGRNSQCRGFNLQGPSAMEPARDVSKPPCEVVPLSLQRWFMFTHVASSIAPCSVKQTLLKQVRKQASSLNFIEIPYKSNSSELNLMTSHMNPILRHIFLQTSPKKTRGGHHLRHRPRPRVAKLRRGLGGIGH